MANGASGRVRKPKPGVLAITRSAFLEDISGDGVLGERVLSATERLAKAGAFPEGHEVTVVVRIIITGQGSRRWVSWSEPSAVDTSQAVELCTSLTEELRQKAVDAGKTGGHVSLFFTITQIGDRSN